MAQCPKCYKQFKKKDGNFSNHVKYCGSRHPCPHCPETCCNPSSLNRHIKNCHPETLLNRGCSSTLVQRPTSTKRTAEVVFHDDVPLEPMPKKLLEEDMIIPPPPVFLNDSIPWDCSDSNVDLIVPPPPMFMDAFMEPASLKRKRNEDEREEVVPENKVEWKNYQGMPEEEYNAAVTQMGGKIPLFEFEVTEIPTVNDKVFNRLTKKIYHTQLHQRREPEEQDDIGVALAKAIESAAQTQLRRMMEKEHLDEESKVYFSMTPNGFPRAFQTKESSVKDILNGSFKTDVMFRKMAGKLNSNESFGGNQTFQMDLIVLAPKFTGSGNGKRLNPGQTGLKVSRHTKKSVITIKNENDDLCCARAIVTMQARSELQVIKKQILEELAKEVQDCDLLEPLYLKEEQVNKKYGNMRKGCYEQTVEAKRLHWYADVPEGPCGLPELKKFQEYLYTLTPPYQLKVVEDLVKKPVYMGDEKVDDDQILVLIRSPNHYDGCASLSGFFNKSYWCHDCDKGFNTNDAKNHSCQGRVCKACHIKDCPDKHPLKPTHPCPDCGGLFYGPTCFQAHKQKQGKKQKSLCDQWHICPDCCAEYKVDPKKPHKCGWGCCRNCKQFVKLEIHKCFIQRDNGKGDRNRLEEEEEIQPDPVEELEEAIAEGKTLPALFVYADIEAMTVAEGDSRKFIPNLLCYQTSEEEQIHSLRGEDICLQFIHRLNELAEVRYEKDGKKKKRTRPVIILFHNLKGYDGLFIMEAHYKNMQEVKNQFGVGSKVFSFESGPLTFKDSLCFLPMPLEAFTETFDLTELKKGFFPHAFNTPDNQSYIGAIPYKKFYDPEGMKKEKKEKFDTWYAEQKRRQEEEGYVYHFQNELEEYCKSDVKLLKEGCDAFVKQFREEADFNPLEKCITIASACNKYWRRSDDFPDDRIAVRPPRGWHGAQTNQSTVALEWMAYLENKIEKEPGEPEHILHVRNGGEQAIEISGKKHKVDGYDPTTETVYEFQGCLWHGCRTCYPNRKDVKHTYLNERTPHEVYNATQEDP